MRPFVLISGGLALVLALAACRQSPPAPAPVGAARVQMERTACEKGGGIYRSLGSSGGLFCQSVPKDAGRSCQRASDCESACLARSNTCAPFKPLVGCNEILTSSGLRVTECVE
ncbi:hypothetical protein [Phaeovulum sp. W22_SRMD_FR3]|uniref:hypothetical protein n=1 Tax=Phaeovulum sp. W22_SRMD_FR3 TaxID=3240274 RepID=UPI003F9CA3C6